MMKQLRKWKNLIAILCLYITALIIQYVSDQSVWIMTCYIVRWGLLLTAAWFIWRDGRNSNGEGKKRE